MLGGERTTDAGKNGGIDCTGIKEEGTEDFLDAFGITSIEGQRLVGRSRKLLLGAVGWLEPGMGQMLRNRWERVLETLESAFDVTGNQDIARASVEVPPNSETTET